MIAYLLLCLASVSAGLGVLSVLRFNVQERRMLFAAPALTLSIWAIMLGIGVSMGATVRQVSPVFWIVTVLLSVEGLRAFRRTMSANAVIGLAWAAAMPIALLAPDAIHGLTNYVGTAWPGDGWSYVAFGQYLWEVPKTTYGRLSPLFQYASHVNGARFIGSGLLAAFTPLNGMPGDTQATVGPFLAWSLFTLGCSCVAVADTVRLGRRWQMLAMSLAVVSPWALAALQMHNYDNLIALSFLPAILALLTQAPEAPARTGAVCGVMLAASLYTYPELAGIIWLGAGLYFVVLLVRRGGRGIWLSAVVALGLVLIVVVPGRDDLISFFAQQARGASAAGGRPGEGGFPELLVSSHWPGVAWRLTRAEAALPAVVMIAAQVVAAAAIAFVVFGYVRLARLGRWDLAAMGLLLNAGLLEMVVRERYGYGAYKFLLFGWWLHCIAGVVAAEAVYAWIHGSRRAVRLAVSIGMMTLAGTLLGVTAARSMIFYAGLPAPSIAPFRRLLEADRIIGADPVIVDVDNDSANVWAAYFLRTHSIYMMQYRGYMGAPHLVERMNLSAPVDLAQARFFLGSSALPDGKVAWSGGPYVLSRLPDAGVALIKSVHNANGNEQRDGRPFYWLGQGDTELRVISTAAGEGLLTADFVRGPSLPERADRRLMLTVNHGSGQVVAVDADHRQAIPVPLAVGENVISLRTLDTPSHPVPRDPRCCLVLGMDSPRLSIVRSMSIHASLEAIVSSDDRVGCAPGALAPDGKPDLRFRMNVDVDAPLDLSAVELFRGQPHPGVWSTGPPNFVLGIAAPGSTTLLGEPNGTLRGQPYAGTALELFACDDGASAPGDTFMARMKLSTGQVVDTLPTARAVH